MSEVNKVAVCAIEPTRLEKERDRGRKVLVYAVNSGHRPVKEVSSGAEQKKVVCGVQKKLKLTPSRS